ncbi:MAG: FAD-dependent oxidoreductase [Burkholderiales bacterium]|nr:FAD-dependent oxidoreductase [Burkholderiales bacterium]
MIDTRLSSHAEGAAFDVVVIGAGGAGLSAALFASLAGARVLLVERTGYVGGTTAFSAGTTWVPLSAPGLAVAPGDTADTVLGFLDHAVGERSPRALREAFVAHGAQAVAELERHTAMRYQVRRFHPDYLSELEGSATAGRAIEPVPFDGRLLGDDLRLVRPPIPEFTVLGGMMVDRDDIGHLLGFTRSLTSLRYVLRILARHAGDRLRHGRGTRLVMGNALVARMLYSLRERGVPLVTHTDLRALRRDASGAITGVLLAQDGDGGTTERAFSVHGGVVLASGGFNRHPARRAELLPGIDAHWCPGAPGHTGSAQDLALAAGARLGQGHRTHAFWAPVSTRMRADGSTAVFPHFAMDRGKPGMLAVDAHGQRFVNESTSYHLFGRAMQDAARPAVPAWLVCDAAALRRYGLGMVRPGGRGLAPYLADGYLQQGDTLAALAGRIGVPAAALEATVQSFNAMARAGDDAGFARGTTVYQRANGDAGWPGPNPCLGELTQAPFYAVRLVPGDIGATTGLVTDANARVLGDGDQAIAGLYACGNDMNSIMADTYPAPGITLGPGLVFARQAARDACRRAGVLPKETV